jgi:carbon-monoxide dehydrogenase large subunit/6-hydroxypseudooxynicotine dehydrogenase subunit gamma
MSLGDVARALEPASRLRGDRAPGLSSDGWFSTDHMNYPYGVHVAVVRVDRETGGSRSSAIRLIRRPRCPYWSRPDAGGFAQGWGALLEEFVRRPRRTAVGQLRRLFDAAAREVPSLDADY